MAKRNMNKKEKAQAVPKAAEEQVKTDNAQANEAQADESAEVSGTELDELKAKLSEAQRSKEECEAKLQAEKDDYKRLLAEFDTFRRRTAEDKLKLVSVAAADTIKELLPVLDACERALSMLADSEDESAKQGITLIHDKLMGALKSKGLKKIEALGQPFDTDFHEAVAQMPAPSEEAKNKVFDVIETGYTLNGEVIRFAKVVVGI